MLRSLTLAAAVLVAASAAAAPLAADKVAPCLACHGENGVSQTDDVPSLAAQPALYTQWQLVFFRIEGRKNEMMGPAAKEMSDDDVKAFGAYFAALPPPPAASGPDPNPALSATGRALAEEHHCNACHDATYAGKDATARLAGQREEVLVKALDDFRTGSRRGTGVASMPEAIYGLGADDFAALAHYLSRLP